MVTFIKSINSKSWKKVIKGWTPPKITGEDGTEYLTPEKDSLKEDDEEANGNSRSLNVIYIGVDYNIFNIIKKISSAKETLQMAHEATSKVRMSILQHLTKNLKIGG